VLLYMPSATDPSDGPSDGPVRPDPTRTGPFSTEATPSDVHVLDDSGFDLRRKSLVMMSTTSAQYQTFRQQVRDGTARATIGSVDATDQIADFSSRGPSDVMTLKPEIVAPGFEIMSTLPSVFGVEGDRYRMSGTSMSTPHVAGAAALLLQARPGLTAARARSVLIGSARELDSVDKDVSPSAQGAGTLDIAAAVDQHVTASPDAVSLGLVDMGGTGSRTEPVVLTNDGAKPVTVTLAVHPSATSAGTATLSTRRVTVPAGGEATVSLSVTPRLSNVDNETSGVLVGTVSDGSALRIPYAAYVRPLAVQATPDPAQGSSQVFVHSGSALLPETGVTLTAVAPSGRRTTVGLTEQPGQEGWYRGRVPLAETGTYTIKARAVVAGRAVTGASTVRSVSADQPGKWQQVGLTGEAAWLAVSPDAPGTALGVTSDSAYPMVTTDRGKTWRRVRSLPVAGGWGLPAADPRTAGAFYLGLNGRSGNAVFDASYQGRILHTPDAGRTWTVLPFRDVAISALFATGSSLVAVVADGVEISADGGQTWRHVQHVWEGTVVHAALAGDDLVVEDLFSIWRVADATGAGAEIEQTYVPEGALVYGIGGDEEATVAVLSDQSMVRSTDGGATWAPIGQSGQDYVTDVQVVDGTLYLSGLSSYTTSEDYGTTLDVHEFPVFGPVVTDVDRWPGSGPDAVLLSMENAGLYETDGDGWDKIGLSATTISSVDVGTDAKGSSVLRVTDQEGLHERALVDLDPAKQDWGSTGHEGYVGVAMTDTVQSPIGAKKVWSIGSTATGSAKILVGAPGEKQQRVGSSGGYDATALAVSPLDEDTVAVGYSSLVGTGWMVSTDGFRTWTSYDTGQYVHQLRFDPRRPGRLWIATEDGLLRSDDLGDSTTRITTAPALSVSVERATRDRVLIGERGALRWSTDAGRTVHRAKLTDTGAAVGSFVRVVVPAGRYKGVELLVAGAEQWRRLGLTVNGGGALVSTDGGRSWVPASGGLTAMSVRTLDASADGAWVFAGTDDGGVHRTSTASLVPRSAVRRTTTRVSAPTAARLGTRPRVSLSVRAGSAPAAGTVLVSVQRAGGGTVMKKTRIWLRDGRVTFRPPALRKAGQYVVLVTYEPRGLFAGSTGHDTIRVRS
jgi:hypothetical protein